MNAYDNTIVYTDHVIAEVIEQVSQKTEAAAVLYLSDHGESLGENGVYLHGLPYAIAPDYQTRIPMIFWASPAFYELQSLNEECVRNSRERSLSHDNLFHSVIGLFKIHTNIYQPELDMFKECTGT